MTGSNRLIGDMLEGTSKCEKWKRGRPSAAEGNKRKTITVEKLTGIWKIDWDQEIDGSNTSGNYETRKEKMDVKKTP
jgi:hypothetical protein